ncbi:MAG: HNH endonuclease [Gammaproteobacteria bacterium]|nr:HNH endonuclease [Gammaproteobacteria bacterium]
MQESAHVGARPDSRPPQSKRPCIPQPFPHRKRAPRPRGDVAPHSLRLLNHKIDGRRTGRTALHWPKSSHTQFIDGHHIQHWADGGETCLDNLVQLCRRHHRLVHEGGFGCERNSEGTLVFTDPRGNIPADYFELPYIEKNANPVAWLDSQTPGLNIDADTCKPKTVAGERMDWNLAVGHLFTEREPERPQP